MSRSLRALPLFVRTRRLQLHPSRWTSSSASPESGNSHHGFYKSFGIPIFKVFLGALFTFQVTYWSWLKLESIETKHNTNAKLAELEGKIVDTVPGTSTK